MTKEASQQRFRFSLVFRLMLSIAIVMVAVFTAGNMVNVHLARKSLMAQCYQQMVWWKIIKPNQRKGYTGLSEKNFKRVYSRYVKQELVCY